MDTTTVVTQVVQGITQVLDELGARFGATGSHLWEQLVTYQMWEALTVIWLMGIGTVIILICLPIGAKLLHSRWDEGEIGFNGMAGVALLIISCMGLIVVATTALTQGPELMATIKAPEAAVLRSLLP